MLTKDIASAWARFRGKEDPNSRVTVVNDLQSIRGYDKVWALKDNNLEVSQGEILGIIGKNGAGKSTLLKIMSRITSPTEGEVRIKGRIGSLLEIGTGFHPELTGRENIFLNGSVLGLRQYEIDRLFNEIVDFSGVRQFIDTPVKRYSPGMYIRLGFAVAAHLNPDILIVDEVLAVGDIEFQKKAAGAIQGTVNNNRTVIFVSHNMEMIKSLCTRCIVIDKGELHFDGNTDEAISKYKKLNRITGIDYKKDCQVIFDDEPNRPFQIASIQITNDLGQEENTFSIKEPIIIHICFIVRENTNDLMVGFQILLSDELLLASNLNDCDNKFKFRIKKGKYKAAIKIPALKIKAGDYQLRYFMGVSNYPLTSHAPKKGLQLKIHDSVDGLELTTFSTRGGKVLFPVKWGIDHKEL
jgi:lipopolysaccharide transport system ATP-binding protein